jgi:hypothetical protein
MLLNEVILTEEQLRAKCAEWQKVLRLQDWDVRTSIVRRSVFTNAETNAEISVNVQHRIAQLRMLDPIDYDPLNVNPQDMEKSLVHELLHIHLWTFTVDLDGSNKDAEEQAINMIAGALIALKRNSEGERIEIPEFHKFQFTSPDVRVDAEGPASIIFIADK